MLTRLSKSDVIGQLAQIRRMAALAGDEVRHWRVRIPRNCDRPAMDIVHDVVTIGDTDYLCPVSMEAGSASRMLELVSGHRLGDMSMEEVQAALSSSSADKVAIGWPQGHHSCVCRVLALTKGDECLAFLFPGPMDMDRVNEELLEYRRTHGCPTPGIDCEQCPRMPGCGILEAAGDEVRGRRETDAE